MVRNFSIVKSRFMEIITLKRMFYYDLSQLAADNILTQRANVLAI